MLRRIDRLSLLCLDVALAAGVLGLAALACRFAWWALTAPIPRS